MREWVRVCVCGHRRCPIGRLIRRALYFLPCLLIYDPRRCCVVFRWFLYFGFVCWCSLRHHRYLQQESCVVENIWKRKKIVKQTNRIGIAFCSCWWDWSTNVKKCWLSYIYSLNYIKFVDWPVLVFYAHARMCSSSTPQLCCIWTRLSYNCKVINWSKTVNLSHHSPGKIRTTPTNSKSSFVNCVVGRDILSAAAPRYMCRLLATGSWVSLSLAASLSVYVKRRELDCVEPSLVLVRKYIFSFFLYLLWLTNVEKWIIISEEILECSMGCWWPKRYEHIGHMDN